MNPRLKKLTTALKAHDLDAYLLTHDVNITYLTRFPTAESWLVVFPKKAYYVTDFRYVGEAQAGLSGIPVKQYTGSIMATTLECVRAHKARRIGFDDRHISLALFKRLKKHFPKTIQWIPANNLVEDLREVKEPAEIQNVRQALKLHRQALQFLKRIVRPGRTERDILLRLERYVKSRGAAFSFDPIIASGPNSWLPHAKVTDRRIRNNEPVLIDMGIDISGYKSDLTRMFFLGKIPPLVKEVNDAVATAQKRAIARIRPGVRASKVDDEARNYLKEKGLAKYFGHSLGHGVGLEIHEAPRLSQTSRAILKKGMIVTVEPAVYFPRKFGIRIEDMVLVTENGCEVLSR